MVVLAALSGCVPVLTSPPGALDPGAEWEAPENTWPTFEPPDDLEGEGFDDGEVVPDFRLTDQNGDEVSLWQFYGKIVVLDVSTMWCSPCRQLAGQIGATVEDYGDDLEYVSVLPQNNDGEIPSQDDLQEWADYYGIPQPVIGDDTGYSYQVVPDGTFPVLVLVDRDMKAIEHIDPLTDEGVRAALDEVL